MLNASRRAVAGLHQGAVRLFDDRAGTHRLGHLFVFGRCAEVQAGVVQDDTRVAREVLDDGDQLGAERGTPSARTR
jgi:hypothetical protein